LSVKSDKVETKEINPPPAKDIPQDLTEEQKEDLSNLYENEEDEDYEIMEVEF
jgi:hypothetical protein